MNTEIREAIESDAIDLRKYVAQLFLENLSTLYKKDEVPSIEAQEKFINQILNAPNSTLLLAVNDSGIIGMLDAHGSSHEQKSHRISFGMSVSRENRRKGIGERLVSSLKDWANGNNIRRIELEVFSNNPNAIALYEKAGFVVEGVKKGAVLIEGAEVDIISMA
ncbi:MAG: GNAT family N-acetyltransferase [Halioglobus sp.]|nr:GNAT family N-acetyltransferase [Halioglobus sp.]